MIEYRNEERYRAIFEDIIGLEGYNSIKDHPDQPDSGTLQLCGQDIMMTWSGDHYSNDRPPKRWKANPGDRIIED